MATLTAANLSLLTEIADAMRREAKVAWINDPDSENVLKGVMRRGFYTEEGYQSATDADVREACVRISGMTEYFMPVQKVMDLLTVNLFHVE